MSADLTFEYVKLFVENSWIIFVLSAVLLLVVRPGALDRVAGVEFLNFKLQLREIEKQVASARQDLEVVRTETSQYQKIMENVDISVPVGELAEVRRSLTNIGARLTDGDLGEVTKGLRPEATPEEVYAAAVIARARKDPALFDELVACLDRIAHADNLADLRLNTVWTLTSALHLTLVAAMKYSDGAITRSQLLRAREVLDTLVKQQRVRDDRPDAPLRGINGPAKHAREWIETGLKGLADK